MESLATHVGHSRLLGQQFTNLLNVDSLQILKSYLKELTPLPLS